MKTTRNILMSLFLATSLSLAQPVSVQTVTVENPTVQAGQSVTGTIRLDAPAPAEGLEVELWTDQEATAKSYVTIPAGQRSAKFTIATSRVAQAQVVKVAALQPHKSVVSSFQVLPTQTVTQK